MIKILVLDDDTDLLEMVEMVLTHRKMLVFPISESRAFFDAINKNEPDIILMDIYLGDADGRDLCRQFKILPQYENIPVILYSAGQITAGSIDESLADEFLEKPFDVNVIINKITEMVTQKKK